MIQVESIFSGGGSSGKPLDPVEVYNNTRPSDWLPMPTPADNEMYLLFHIPDGFSSLLAFTVTCTGNYTVALGTMSGGSFVASSSVDIASGSKYEVELFANDYGDLTSDGMKQVMVKVSGTNIYTLTPSTHSKKTSPSNFAAWNIVEISCRLPSGTSVKCGNDVGLLSLRNMRYFTLAGDHNITNMLNMFRKCCSLTSIPSLDTKNVTNMSFMFYSCYVLKSIPQMNTEKVTNMSYMFNNCHSLISIPSLDTKNVTEMQYIFEYCYNLNYIPQMNTGKVTDMRSMFNGCSTLKSIPQMNTGKVKNMTNAFNACFSLAAIIIDNTVTGWAGYAISLSNCSLGHAAIVAFFNSLPTITSAKAITLTGNPGVSELTDAEKAVATGKGWTLTL